MDPKATILLVEDSRFLRTAAADTLRNHGFTVLEAMTGEEAVRLARAFVPDLVLLDFIIPGMSGRDVLEVLKHDSRTEHIPIVVLSGANQQAAQDALTKGAHAFLAKQSAGVTDLLALVELVLATRAAREAHAAIA